MLRHSSRSRRSAPRFAEKRNITEKDLWDFVWIGDPQVSPDGSRVAFVRVTVNEKKEGYNTSIWSVPVAGGEAPRQLTKGDHDTTPRWSPDGKFLLFLRSTEKDGKPEPPQLAMLPMAGGDSFVFTDLPRGAGSPVWAPDGKNIAFTSDTNAEDLAKQEKKKSEEASSDKGRSRHDAALVAGRKISAVPALDQKRQQALGTATNSQCCQWPAAIPLFFTECRRRWQSGLGARREKHRVHKRYERGGRCKQDKKKIAGKVRVIRLGETSPPPRLRRAGRRTRQHQVPRAKRTPSTRATCA